MKNDRFLKALKREPVDRTPIWLMRQAGRYLPKYRALRQEAPDFLAFCRNVRLATEATLVPFDDLDLDAAILFSDILTLPAAMGATVRFTQGEGPGLEMPIRSLEAVQALRMIQPDVDCSYVLETIQNVRRQLNVPLIGFAGSPWTVACYLVEGSSSSTFTVIRQAVYQKASWLTALLERLTEATIHYLNAQIEAGANAIMLFDTWGGLLTQSGYSDFSLRYMRLVRDQLHRHYAGRDIPVIFFTKGGGQWLPLMADAGCDAVGVDWMTDLAEAKQAVGHRVALQGNLDPAVLLSSPDVVRQAAEKVLKAYGDGPGHIFNLGHGLYPSTPVENVQALIEAVHSL